jgi:YfiH family protein
MMFLKGGLPATHGFFTRVGGVSTGLYESLNCGFSGGDDAAHVAENRARVAAQMLIPAPALLGCKQVHGAGVVTVTAPWAVGAGPAADALVTALPGFGLSVITADCAPVLFAAANGVVGAAHAGWRGALAGVLEATVAAMQAAGGVGIIAAIGPCIGVQSYEVAADLRDAVLARAPADERFFAPGRPARWQFDLAGYAQARLASIGVPTVITGQDTCADEAVFFSYRRKTRRGEPATGHQISVICS